MANRHQGHQVCTVLILVLLLVTCVNPVSAQVQVVLEPLVVESGPIVAGFNNYVYVVLASAGGTVLAYVVTSHPNTVQPLTSTTGGLAQAIADGLNEMKNHGKNIWMSLVDKHVVTTYTPGSAEYNIFQIQIDQIEHDYNDAKEKGTPTKNHKDRTIGEKDENYKGVRSLKTDGTAYSSQRLFGDATDKQNGCPDQIRYYGKDGKAEEDIDFNGPVKEIFPHRHTWRHDLIAQGVKGTKQTRPYTELGDAFKKLWEANKCKNYDYKNHIFKKGGL